MAVQSVRILLLVVLSTSIYFQCFGRKPKNLRTFETESPIVYGMCFSPQGSILAIGDGPEIKFYSFKDNVLIDRFIDGHVDQIMAIDWESDSNLIASGDRDGTVIIRDPRNGDIIKKFHFPKSIITSVSFSPGAEYLAVSGTCNKVYIINILLGNLEKELIAHEDDVLKVRFSPAGNLLVSSGADGKVVFYNTDDFNVISMSSENRHWVRTIAFNSDGTRLLAGNDRGIVQTWSVSDPARIRMIVSHRLSSSWITGLSFHSDKLSFAIVNTYGQLIIRTPFSRLQTRLRFPINDVQFKPDEEYYMIFAIATRGGGVISLDALNMKSRKL